MRKAPLSSVFMWITRTTINCSNKSTKAALTECLSFHRSPVPNERSGPDSKSIERKLSFSNSRRFAGHFGRAVQRHYMRRARQKFEVYSTHSIDTHRRRASVLDSKAGV